MDVGRLRHRRRSGRRSDRLAGKPGNDIYGTEQQLRGSPCKAYDVEAIAAAHLDSIRTIGAVYYAPAIVSDWCARVKGDLYVSAMTRGEVFYIAVGELSDKREVLGFSSHRIYEREHRTAVYVRGNAARLGIGSALFRSAEAAAISAGATSIHVDASLAAVEFYEANGFDEVGRGEHRLWSGRSMACVFMRKRLVRPATRSATE